MIAEEHVVPLEIGLRWWGMGEGRGGKCPRRGRVPIERKPG